jgi:hypothetical protein
VRWFLRLLLALALIAPGAAAPAATPGQIVTLLGSLDPYPSASAALDFTGSNASGVPFYKLPGTRCGAVFTCLPGLSVTRASSGYAQDTSGNLVSFASGVARTTNLGLLVEEARTNLLKWSQDFTHAGGFTANAVTPTASGLTAPDGTATGQTLTASAGNTNHEVYQTDGISSATNYAVSIYAKPGTTRYVFITIGGSAANYAFAVFDLQGATGAATQTGVGGTSGTIASTSQQSVAGGWQRLTMVAQIAATSDFIAYGIAGAATGNTVNTTGEVTFNAAGTETIGIWQADQQLGSFITSPILTTSATATRPADVVKITGLSLPNTAFTIIDRGVTTVTMDGTERHFTDWGVDGSSSDHVQIYRSTANRAQTIANVGGVTQYSQTSIGTFTGALSLAIGIAYDGSIYTGASAGAAFTSSAAGKTAPVLSTIRLGDYMAGGFPLNGYVQTLLFYPSAFSGAQLQAATQ